MASPQPKPLDAKTLGQVAEYLIAARRQESVQFNEIHAWERNEVISVFVPEKARHEYRQLVEQSRWNILTLLIDALANEFFVDGYRPNPAGKGGRRRAKDEKNAAVWDNVWQPNRMDARQAGLWRAALKYGLSYATVLPGTLNGKDSAVITPWSPRRLTALYDDALNDEWARYALEVGTDRPKFGPNGVEMVTPVTIYDDQYAYRMELPAAMLATRPYSPFPQVWNYQPISVNTSEARAEHHGLGYCPVVRFLPTWGELDDGPQGVVFPMIPAQRQLNQSTYSLGIAELFGAFTQKWVAGLDIELDENGNPKEPFNSRIDAILQAEDPDTKFGTFSQTDLKGYLDSRDKTMLFISSVRQIPPHKLVVGDSVSNVSAEALAALRDGHGQDVAAHRTSFGESAEQMLRLAGLAMGDTAAWEDTSAQARWRDTTPRSLAQVADALGKLATQLEIPPRALWERIPDVTDQDLARWEQMFKEDDSFGRLREMINGARPGRQPAVARTPAASGADR